MNGSLPASSSKTQAAGGRRHRNPVVAQRWRRFTRRRRAVASLGFLAALYLVSLAANVICNHRPLLVRYRGRWYIPLLRYYPEDTFTGSGRWTRPDYRRIAASPEFTEHRGHFMVFAPVPYGPYESVDPESLRREEDVTVEWHPYRRAAALRVDNGLRLREMLAAEPFLHDSGERPPSEARLDESWVVSDGLRRALETRFRNEAAPAYYETLAPRHEAARPAEAALAPFHPRPRAPETVRMILREPAPDGPETGATVVFGPDGRIRAGEQAWKTLPESAREYIRERLEQRHAHPLTEELLEVAGRAFLLQFGLHDIQWPHPPVRGHWLGLDGAGRDVLARILYGLRISMHFGLLLVLLSYALGILAGALQGYYAGRVDIVAQRLTEIWSALPFLYVMILMGSIFGPSFGLLLACYGLFNWIGISYYVRAETLRLRRLPFVDAARALGVPGRRIIRRHILPNALTPVITFFPFSLVGAISALAALDFLGFGLPPPTPSLGQLLQQAMQYRWAWWLILYPTLALVAIILPGVFVGEGIRDAHDPKPYSRME